MAHVVHPLRSDQRGTGIGNPGQLHQQFRVFFTGSQFPVRWIGKIWRNIMKYLVLKVFHGFLCHHSDWCSAAATLRSTDWRFHHLGGWTADFWPRVAKVQKSRSDIQHQVPVFQYLYLLLFNIIHIYIYKYICINIYIYTHIFIHIYNT